MVWDTSKVINMSYMFEHATNFNKDYIINLFLFKIKYITTIMTHTIEHSNDELMYLVHKINDYEYGLYQILNRNIDLDIFQITILNYQC